MCSHNTYKSKSENYSHQLYDIYKKSLEEYISCVVLPALREQHDEFLLKEFLKHWENYKAFVRYMSGMFYYLIYHILWTDRLPLREVGLMCFREALPDDTHINLKNVVFDLIKREREGEQVDSASLRKFVDMYLDIGFDALLRDDKKIDICRICKLFCKIPKGLPPVASIFQQHIISRGIDLIKCAEDTTRNNNSSSSRRTHGLEFLGKLIEIYDQYVGYLENEFQNDNSISKALHEALLVICNKRVGGTTSEELFAAFWDNLLKKGGSLNRTDDDNIESLLEKVVKLVRYVSDKDLFAEFCRKYLAKRLLHDRGINIDDEQKKLSKLKEPCGSSLISKMERMVKDFVVSKEIQAEFNNSAYNDMKLTLDVTVLNATRWPTCKSSNLYLPSEMAACLVKFQEFYSLTYQHRTLTWAYSLGTCDIISKFDTTVIELSVTTYQAALLLLFNEAIKLSYEEIKSQLNLEDEDVIRLLHSVSCGKYKILLKEPSTATISTTDNFEFNTAFSHKLKKIKIPFTEVNVNERNKVI
eukprot:PITA_08338